MNEKEANAKFRKNVIKPMDRYDRIENIVGVGNPDINYCIVGVEGWIETKCPKEPKRPGTPLFGSSHRLSIDQKNWFLRQKNSGGEGWVLILTDKNRWLLINGCKYADEINTATIESLIKMSAYHCINPNSDDFGNIRDLLSDHSIRPIGIY